MDTCTKLSFTKLSFARLTIAAVAAAMFSACAGPDPSSPAAKDQVANMEARLRPVGSGATGKVIVVDNGPGVTLTLDVANLTQGIYRLAFHASPVCNSPGGESAGPVWGPPDSAVPPSELIPVAYAGQAGNISFSVRIPGVHIDREPSLRGRSIVLHAGPFVDSPLPGMPNNYIACGVFDNLSPGLLERLVK
jgi:Cu/Zn superoxide dismutase